MVIEEEQTYSKLQILPTQASFIAHVACCSVFFIAH